MSIRSFDVLKQAVVRCPPVPVAVAAATEPEVIASLRDARRMGFVGQVMLSGPEEAVREAIRRAGDEPGAYVILPAADEAHAARLAVAQVRDHGARLLVKGNLKTEAYLKALLDRDSGIRTSAPLLSNVSVFEMPSYHKLLALTDNAVVIAPTLEEKKTLIENTHPLWKALQIDQPKVAVLAAVETVNPRMPATLDAAALVVMNHRRQLKGFVVDGPLAYDAAINREAAVVKGITESPVTGDPDLLLAPDIEAANALGKSFKFHGQATWGGLLFGARVPAILNSRSDDHQNRLNSLLLARMITEHLP